MNKNVYSYVSQKSNDPIVEWKTCQSSGEEFPIYKSDLEFYNKISPILDGQKIPMPTPKLCPEERFKRRLNFRHETKLYTRTCDFTGKKIISAYSPDKPYKVYDHQKYWTDGRNPLDFGIDYDNSKSFFDQYNQLMLKVPRISLLTDIRNENSPYVNQANQVRNCYMIWGGINNDSCYYNYRIFNSKNCMDNSFIYDSEFLYGCLDVDHSYNCKFSIKSSNCNNSSFLYNCKDCNDCFMCANLVNKQYYYKNTQCTKEEYNDIISQQYLGISANIKKLQSEFEDLVRNSIHKSVNNLNSTNVYGNLIYNSTNSSFCFDSVDIEKCKYSVLIAQAKHCYDLSYSRDSNNLVYEGVTVGEKSYKTAFCIDSWNLQNCYYCDTCINSKNLFGCIGLNNKEYCIFNTQYTKEDYEKKVLEIISNMQKLGERGEFFPISISSLCYNETPANIYFPMNKYKANSLGYKRSEYISPMPNIDSIKDIKDLSVDIKSITDDVLNYTVKGEQSDRPFRIIKQELEFYRKMGLSLPTKHYDIRNLERMKKRESFNLYLSKCFKTGEEILSVYPGDTKLKIYSEDAFNQKIY